MTSKPDNGSVLKLEIFDLLTKNMHNETIITDTNDKLISEDIWTFESSMTMSTIGVSAGTMVFGSVLSAVELVEGLAGQNFLTGEAITGYDRLAHIGSGMMGVLPGSKLLSKLKGATTSSSMVANSTCGWKVGQPITNLTRNGKVPTWDTIRRRFWKNETATNAGSYDPAHLPRMRKGLAPQRTNPNTGALESMELHHDPSRKAGGLFDFRQMWPDAHRALHGRIGR